LDSLYLFTDSVGFGGAERAMLTLLEGLDRHRFRPTVVHHGGGGVGRLLEAARALDVELWQVPRMDEGRDGVARVPAFAVALRARRPSVFHAHLTWPISCKFALAAAVLARVPAVVATAHAFAEFPVGRSALLQQRVLSRAVGRYIAVSEYLKRRLCATFGWPQSKVAVIFNGVDADRLCLPPDPELRRRLSRDGSRRVLLATARLDPEKGLDVLLRAARRLDGAQVVIAGEGPERPALQALAASLGLGDRVDFLGHREDVPALLACCDAYVLPSRNEAFALGALEAMAAGRPVAASAVGGVGELIDDGRTGLLVAPGDADALAHALRRLLEQPALTERLTRAAAARARERFSAARMVAAVVDIYRELLDQTPRQIQLLR
jgi:glycosyltransferase involved in cell wall biosynthesis